MRSLGSNDSNLQKGFWRGISGATVLGHRPGDAEAHPYQLENELSPKGTGPFRVTEAPGNGVYRLETLEGGAIPRTYNATNLKFYFG